MVPAKVSLLLDPATRRTLTEYAKASKLNTSAAIRVLLARALNEWAPGTLHPEAVAVQEARREVRARAKEALARALSELDVEA